MSQNKILKMTPTEIRRHDEELVAKTMTLVCSCLMDEFDMDKEQIRAFAERFNRYNEAVGTHLITVRQVAQIVEDEIGVVCGGW